ncbi:hypothetical protein M427DRAFT_383756 [Gonapodya prolifera JEL478]|uniref:Uncharacterized protein n=1 Tax=Gonapodya prolifera (strain JEL478) TaxID=1344416 RepID=A0A139A8S6_GONPJ|nr:hypothetical protein M427DRAFT_383756 [Gonapodya prolifera JEL478]|eukprot:KXS13190.1 hypothetical protein M427DRAFT_383756 [Gonapodya prolifera JEL478]
MSLRCSLAFEGDLWRSQDSKVAQVHPRVSVKNSRAITEEDAISSTDSSRSRRSTVSTRKEIASPKPSRSIQRSNPSLAALNTNEGKARDLQLGGIEGKNSSSHTSRPIYVDTRSGKLKSRASWARKIAQDVNRVYFVSLFLLHIYT